MWEDLVRGPKLTAKKRKKICKRCGGTFEFVGIGRMYCENCARIDAEQFQAVRDYLYEHGPANALDIEEATGISKEHINKYLREGRLEIPPGSNEYITCEICGAKLRYGRFCPECAHKMSSEEIQSATFDVNEIGEVQVSGGNKGQVRYIGKEGRKLQ
ncbi:MAG: hypothetical protein K6B15_03195 [Parasporobacterium sp.]|nr:hypothetical protein [Parasporobacterium sp.]